MLINLIIALLAYFLSNTIILGSPGLISFFFWCLILFFVTGAGFAYTYRGTPDATKRWIL